MFATIILGGLAVSGRLSLGIGLFVTAVIFSSMIALIWSMVASQNQSVVGAGSRQGGQHQARISFFRQERRRCDSQHRHNRASLHRPSPVGALQSGSKETGDDEEFDKRIGRPSAPGSGTFVTFSVPPVRIE